MRAIGSGPTVIKTITNVKKQLFANKCNNADEMDQFLERHTLLKYPQQVVSVVLYLLNELDL